VAVAEFVGGPRDGERFVIPGPLPPERITVLNTAGGPVKMWHPAHGADVVDVVICELEDVASSNNRPDSAWRYLWPRRGAPVTPQ
jgi:hypothetical protein